MPRPPEQLRIVNYRVFYKEPVGNYDYETDRVTDQATLAFALPQFLNRGPFTEGTIQEDKQLLEVIVRNTARTGDIGLNIILTNCLPEEDRGYDPDFYLRSATLLSILDPDLELTARRIRNVKNDRNGHSLSFEMINIANAILDFPDEDIKPAEKSEFIGKIHELINPYFDKTTVSNGWLSLAAKALEQPEIIKSGADWQSYTIASALYKNEGQALVRGAENPYAVMRILAYAPPENISYALSSNTTKQGMVEFIQDLAENHTTIPASSQGIEMIQLYARVIDNLPKGDRDYSRAIVRWVLAIQFRFIDEYDSFTRTIGLTIADVRAKGKPVVPWIEQNGLGDLYLALVKHWDALPLDKKAGLLEKSEREALVLHNFRAKENPKIFESFEVNALPYTERLLKETR